VVVPDLIGKRFDQAFQALQRAGLAAEFKGVGSRVIRQVPAPGSHLEPGGKVRVYLR
jgi:beta-lactam-binding protein with PASTA domain